MYIEILSIPQQQYNLVVDRDSSEWLRSCPPSIHRRRRRRRLFNRPRPRCTSVATTTNEGDGGNWQGLEGSKNILMPLRR